MSWVFAAKCRALTGLSRKQGDRGVFLDSCFTGEGLVGSDRVPGLRRSGVLAQFEEHDGGSTVRFGGGSAVVQKILVGTVQVGTKTMALEVSVVRGMLPFLLGDSALHGLSLMLDCDTRTVTQKTERGTVWLSTWEKGHMPMVQLELPYSHAGGVIAMVAADVETVVEGARAGDARRGAESTEGAREIARDVKVNEEPVQVGCAKEEDATFKDDVAKIEDAVAKEKKRKEEEEKAQEWKRPKKIRKKSERSSSAEHVRRRTNTFAALVGDERDDEESEAEPTFDEFDDAEPADEGEHASEPGEVHLSSPAEIERNYVELRRTIKAERDTHEQLSPQRLLEMEEERGERERVECGDPLPDVEAEDPSLAAPKKHRKFLRKVRRVKALELTDDELKRLHRAGHANAGRLFRFLRSTCADKENDAGSRKAWRHLQSRVDKVVASCGQHGACGRHEKRRKRGLKVPELVDYNRRGWVDFFQITSSPPQWGMAIVDEGTGEVALVACQEGRWTGLSAIQAYFVRWASLRGPHDEIVSDVGGELTSREFIKTCEEWGCFKRVTAASSSESHGRVERCIRTLRWSLDRLLEDNDTKKWTPKEWQVALCSIENAMRNELIVGEHSSSMRAWGRSTTIHRNVLSDSEVTGDGCENLGTLLKVQEAAVQAYRAVVHDVKLRKLLVQRAPTKAEVLAVMEIGDKVKYLREGDRGRGKKWHGPAVFAGRTEHYTHVDHAGVLLKVHPLDVAPWGDSQQVAGLKDEGQEEGQEKGPVCRVVDLPLPKKEERTERDIEHE